MIQNTAPILDIEIGGKTRKLMMGFLACRKIKLNPLKNVDVQAYMADLDMDKAVAFVIAGIENATVTLKLMPPEPPPSEEEIMEALDFHQFLAIVTKAFEAPGNKTSGDESIPNP